MADIFDNRILCKKCEKVMKPELLTRNGFNLRAIKCEKCGEILVHPADKAEYDEFMRLKQKDFEVKMRMVGNSYAISIPREIVDFMKESENMINDMVKLSFQQAGRLSLAFNTPEMNEQESETSNAHHQIQSRVVRAREVQVIRNNKPVLHVKQVSDSANPRNNQIRIVKAKQLNEEDEDED